MVFLTSIFHWLKKIQENIKKYLSIYCIVEKCIAFSFTVTLMSPMLQWLKHLWEEATLAAMRSGLLRTTEEDSRKVSGRGLLLERHVLKGPAWNTRWDSRRRDGIGKTPVCASSFKGELNEWLCFCLQMISIYTYKNSRWDSQEAARLGGKIRISWSWCFHDSDPNPNPILNPNPNPSSATENRDWRTLLQSSF